MSAPLRLFLILLAWPPLLEAQTSNRAQKDAEPSILLDPSNIRITDHFEAPNRAAAVVLATRSLEMQMDAKRDAENARSTLEPFWQASFWNYIPIARVLSGGPSWVMTSPTVK